MGERLTAYSQKRPLHRFPILSIHPNFGCTATQFHDFVPFWTTEVINFTSTWIVKSRYILESQMQKLTTSIYCQTCVCRCMQQKFDLPFNAMTLLAGFMMAESAEIGLLIGLVGSDMSMITTWAVSPTFSRTQMYLKLKTMIRVFKIVFKIVFDISKSGAYLSDSMVRELNPMFAGVIPTFVSCNSSDLNTYH